MNKLRWHKRARLTIAFQFCMQRDGVFAALEEIKTSARSLTSCITADGVLADCPCFQDWGLFVWEKDRVTDRAITQPFGSDILFSSQTGLDVSVPLMCYCWAEALVVDHCENCEAQGTAGSWMTAAKHTVGRYQSLAMSWQHAHEWITASHWPEDVNDWRRFAFILNSVSYIIGLCLPTTRCIATGASYSSSQVVLFVIYIQLFQEQKWRCALPKDS